MNRMPDFVAAALSRALADKYACLALVSAIVGALYFGVKELFVWLAGQAPNSVANTILVCGFTIVISVNWPVEKWEK